MKEEQQRIKIAEACGWKNADHPEVMALKVGWTMPEKFCMNPKGELCFNHDRPDYLNDLNAMHEAELALGLKYDQWTRELRGVCERERRCVESATAALRAEAFLRTLGLREDGE